MNSDDEKFLANLDVLIVGSGPIGAVFARRLVEAGQKVAMIDMGEQTARLIGDHKKNNIVVPKDISRFTHVVKGDLSLLSVPTTGAHHTIEPSSCFVQSFAENGEVPGFVSNGQNPFQKAHLNLPEAAATRSVGGMGSHWTCCTPRQHPMERADLFTEEVWAKYYTAAEAMFWTNRDYVDEDSIRQNTIKEVLAQANPGRHIDNMPLACRRSEDNKNFTQWASTSSLLGKLSDPALKDNYFRMFSSVQCTKLELVRRNEGFQVTGAEVLFLLNNEQRVIKVRKYVICAGAILTPGILYNSGFRSGFEDPKLSNNEQELQSPPLPTVTLPAFGRYMTEQTLAFCQIVLKTSVLERISKDGRWMQLIQDHGKKSPCDPIPIPFNDPDPQCYFPLTKYHPWHTKIHRDAFGYGDVPPSIDQRLVVDLRWFGYVEPNPRNQVTFTKLVKDDFGMPQPIFNFELSADDSERCHRMMTDMTQVARQLGGFLSGAEPKYLPPGSALHICGTYRAGKDENTSVVNERSKVWGVGNLVLGGCGVIPTANASNPTLTAACFAIAAVEELILDLGVRQPQEPED